MEKTLTVKTANVIAIVEDMGDPSVGLMPIKYMVEMPFVPEDILDNDLDYFRNALSDIYKEYAQGNIRVYFDCDGKRNIKGI